VSDLHSGVGIPRGRGLRRENRAAERLEELSSSLPLAGVDPEVGILDPELLAPVEALPLGGQEIVIVVVVGDDDGTAGPGGLADPGEGVVADLPALPLGQGVAGLHFRDARIDQHPQVRSLDDGGGGLGAQRIGPDGVDEDLARANGLRPGDFRRDGGHCGFLPRAMLRAQRERL
jgi:hypothetical protein